MGHNASAFDRGSPPGPTKHRYSHTRNGGSDHPKSITKLMDPAELRYLSLKFNQGASYRSGILCVTNLAQELLSGTQLNEAIRVLQFLSWRNQDAKRSSGYLHNIAHNPEIAGLFNLATPQYVEEVLIPILQIINTQKLRNKGFSPTFGTGNTRVNLQGAYGQSNHAMNYPTNVTHPRSINNSNRIYF